MGSIKCTVKFLLVTAFALKYIRASAMAPSNENWPEEKVCEQYCECRSYNLGYSYKKIICLSWEKFVKLGSDPRFRAEKKKDSRYWTMFIRLQDKSSNGIEFVDVKDHPCQETITAKKENLRTLVIDLSKVVGFKNVTAFEISQSVALKFLNPHFFKLFKFLSGGIIFDHLQNLQNVPYIQVPVGDMFLVRRLVRLRAIKGCGKEICQNYRGLREITIFIGKSYSESVVIENLGLPKSVIMKVRIGIVEPYVQIDPNIFSGRKFAYLGYQTFGSMNSFNLENTTIRSAFLHSKSDSWPPPYTTDLEVAANLVHGHKISPDFHTPFFHSRGAKSIHWRLTDVSSGTLVSVISVPPTLNDTGKDYRLCEKIDKYNYPKETFTSKDTRRTLRYISVDVSYVLEAISDSVNELTIYTLHAIISKDVILRSNLKLTLYYATLLGYKNTAIYERAPKNDPHISDFSTRVMNFKYADEIDPMFAQMAFVCMALMSQGTEQKNLNVPFEETTQWKIFQSMPFHIIDQPFVFNNTENNLAVGNAFRGMKNFIYSFRAMTEETNHVPYLSLDSLKELLVVLQDSGKMALKRQRNLLNDLAFRNIMKVNKENMKLNKENLVKILKGQVELELSLLRDSERRAYSLASIANRTRIDLSENVEKLNSTVEKLQEKVTELRSKVDSLEDEFKDAVKKRETEAYAEAAAATVSAIFSIFSGGFDPNKAIKAVNKARKIAKSFKAIIKVTENLKKLMTKLKNLARKISSVFKNLRNLAGTLVSNFLKKVGRFFKKDWKELNPATQKKIIEATKNIHERSEDITELVDSIILVRRSINVVKLGFDPGDEADVKKLANNLTVVDVLKWDLARDHVTGMMDASLSIEVPETLNFKTALLKVLRTGKAETQARIDLAKAGEELSAAEHSFKEFINELVGIREAIISAENKKKNREDTLKQKDVEQIRPMVIKSRLDTEWKLVFEEFQIKIELYLHTREFCKAYLYFHLTPCPPELQFNLDDSLDLALRVANRLQYQSVQQLKNLYPPPQTFYNKTIYFRIPAKCECVKPLDNLNAINNPRYKDDVENAYRNSATCLEIDSSSISNQSKQEMFILSEECKLSLVSVMKTDNEISFDVPIDSTLFEYRDRVRVDEVQVYLKGAKTESGKLEVWIQTAGLSEDRYRGRVYSFTGENWLRVFSYYSEDAIKSTEIKRHRRNIQRSNEKWGERRTVDSSVIDELKRIEQRLDGMATKQTDMEHMMAGIKGKLQVIERSVKMKSENSRSVLESANVHKSFYGIYRVPTPFTTWIISVPPDRNRGLDLRGLYEMEVSFSGSFIAVPRGKTT